MMTTSSPIWPAPAELFSWFGKANISCNSQDPTTIPAIQADAFFQSYSRWYGLHEEVSSRIDGLQVDLQNPSVERATMSSLKSEIKKLEKELRAIQMSTAEQDLDETLEKLVASQAKTKEWKERYDKLFELTDSLRSFVAVSAVGSVNNTYVHKIKPHEPVRFD
jgi:hypothetical protein